MIAFIFDDRLPHDRKQVFQRTVLLLRTKFQIEVLPSHFTEDDLVEHLGKEKYELVLLPWYKYLAWKKVDAFFGALRMKGPTVAGYFADPVLPFEFAQPPNTHRMILVDLFRFDQQEIELVLRSLTDESLRTGFQGLIPRDNPVYFANWQAIDQSSTRVIDEIMGLPIFTSVNWKHRRHPLRFFLTGMWAFVFPEMRAHPSQEEVATLEVSEFNHKLLIKVLFRNQDYTLKHLMEWFWPNPPSGTPALLAAIREMNSHADYLRVQSYPETNQIELTAMFVESNASMLYPNEVRGFWIEPLQTRSLSDG